MLEEMRREMLRLKMMGWKTAGWTTGARGIGTRAVTGVMAVGLLVSGAAQARAQASTSNTTTSAQPAQTPIPIYGSKIGPAAPVTYANRYEIYGGLNFMNFQGGQALPNRMNMGGGELLGTYWLTKHLGLGADYRVEAGTTPVFANPYVNNRPLVYMNIGMLGAQWRGPKNQYVAVNYHGYAGVGAGVFRLQLERYSDPVSFHDRALYKSNEADSGAGRQHRLQPVEELGDSAFSRPDSRTLRDGDA